MRKSRKPTTPKGVSTASEATTTYLSPLTYQKTEEYNNEKKHRARERLCKYVTDDVIGGQHVFTGPFGLTPETYVDYVASARSLHCIEDYIQDHVLPTYANTHTEVSFAAQQTQIFRDEARAIIKQSVNAGEKDAVIFCGSGSTSAVNKLIATLNPGKGFHPLVFVGPYEHHSNMLPWMQIPGSKVIRIREKDNGLVDVDHLVNELQKNSYCFKKRKHVFGSFSAGSNVTGILTDVHAICEIMHKYNGYAFFDYACVAPYVNIDMNPNTVAKNNLIYKDAIFISTHKFLGGPGTPGLLIAKKHCFASHVPHNLGGGTVQYVRREKTSYRTEIEEREEGGTPAIVESIRAGLVFKLKETFSAAFIMTKEENMLRRAKKEWAPVNPLVILGSLEVARLPIFPILVYNFETGRFLHHDFVAMVFNDVFGLQVRSGCSCAGPYTMDCLGLSEKKAKEFEEVVVKVPHKKEEGKKKRKSSETFISLRPGFVRLNLPYFMADETFNFVVKAVKMVAEHGWKLLYLYDFDAYTGKWFFKNTVPNQDTCKHLHDVTFDTGRMEIVEGLHKTTNGQSNEVQKGEVPCVPSNVPEGMIKPIKSAKQSIADATRGTAKYSSSPNIKTEDTKKYADVLRRANVLLNPKKEVIERQFNHNSTHQELLNHKLRWFMLPEESVDLLLGEKVEKCPPSQLPFMPKPLSVKLGLTRASLADGKKMSGSYEIGMTDLVKYKTVSPEGSIAASHGPSVSWIH